MASSTDNTYSKFTTETEAEAENVTPTTPTAQAPENVPAAETTPAEANSLELPHASTRVQAKKTVVDNTAAQKLYRKQLRLVAEAVQLLNGDNDNEVVTFEEPMSEALQREIVAKGYKLEYRSSCDWVDGKVTDSTYKARITLPPKPKNDADDDDDDDETSSAMANLMMRAMMSGGGSSGAGGLGLLGLLAGLSRS